MSATNMNEKCVICGSETPYQVDLDISLRNWYVEGAGQLCRKCHEAKTDDDIPMLARLIRDTPNDAELGARLRVLYNAKKTNI